MSNEDDIGDGDRTGEKASRTSSGVLPSRKRTLILLYLCSLIPVFPRPLMSRRLIVNAFVTQASAVVSSDEHAEDGLKTRQQTDDELASL